MLYKNSLESLTDARSFEFRLRLESVRCLATLVSCVAFGVYIYTHTEHIYIRNIMLKQSGCTIQYGVHQERSHATFLALTLYNDVFFRRTLYTDAASINPSLAPRILPIALKDFQFEEYISFVFSLSILPIGVGTIPYWFKCVLIELRSETCTVRRLGRLLMVRLI